MITKTASFKSEKNNRGNDGNGTKKEVKNNRYERGCTL